MNRGGVLGVGFWVLVRTNTQHLTPKTLFPFIVQRSGGVIYFETDARPRVVQRWRKAFGTAANTEAFRALPDFQGLRQKRSGWTDDGYSSLRATPNSARFSQTPCANSATRS